MQEPVGRLTDDQIFLHYHITPRAALPLHNNIWLDNIVAAQHNLQLSSAVIVNKTVQFFEMLILVEAVQGFITSCLHAPL